MTRDAEHTPSLQSVVVPVEPTEAMMKAADAVDWSNEDERASAINMWQSMLSAAPAPSSLAGGDVTDAAVERAAQALVNYFWDGSQPAFDRKSAKWKEHHVGAVRAVLAALSPEAPAREAAETWNPHQITPNDIAAILDENADCSDHGGGLLNASQLAEKIWRAGLAAQEVVDLHAIAKDAAERVHKNGGCVPQMAYAPILFALQDALTPRHKAPAEGAGEREEIARIVEPSAFVEETTDHSRVYRNLNLQEGRAEAFTKADKIIALRARSSAPEAREEALGNLLAVIHGDGGHRALEVGTKQAALEAEKIVAGLLAAPSADKLRIAVEALEPFAKGGDHRTMPGLSPSYTVADFGDGVVVTVADFRRAAEALADLKAEGA